MMRNLLIIFLFFVFATPLAAAVMSSTNYSLQSDSINFGGGLSSSTNYTQESTAGEVATGDSASASYMLHAGYQQMTPVFISLSVSPVTMSPDIPSIGGGTANGQTTVTVTTDDAAGYQLSIAASSSPAMVSGANSFADYVTGGANPDFNWSVPATASEFGFTPEGSYIVQRFKDNGSVCDTGSLDTTNSCWAPLTTSNQLIAQTSSGSYPTGSDTVLKFRAESGASHTQPGGAYVATSTVTAIAL
jgi:hypothetical protein